MRRIVTWLFIATPFLLGCGLCSGLLESSQMKRAREFVAASEFESARQELRVQLHNDPDDLHAKALLLFMQLAESPAGEASGAAQCMLLGAMPGSATSTAAEESLKQAKLDIRKRQLDLGISTTDWEQYATVLREAVQYGWSQHEFPTENVRPKLTFAFCAAIQGDAKGVDYLVDHLAQDDTRDASRSYLYLIGESAAPSLEVAMKNPENLASKHAGETLRNLHLAKQLEAFSSRSKERTSPTTVRTDGSEGRNGSSGRFLMKLGWRDDNESLRPVFAAALARESLPRLLAGAKQLGDDASPVMVRVAEVGSTWIAVFTAALPSTQSTEAAPADGSQVALRPAGVNTTFLTEVLRWTGTAWAPLPLGSKPSMSGPDLALLAVNGVQHDPQLSADQVAFLVYRGLQQTQTVVNLGWYGSRLRTVDSARVDRMVYHLGATSLEPVKVTNAEGIELDANGQPIMPLEEMGYGD